MADGETNLFLFLFQSTFRYTPVITLAAQRESLQTWHVVWAFDRSI